MKTTDIFKRSARNLKSAKMRTILTALAIAVGGFALTVTLAAAAGVRTYANNLVTSNYNPNELLVARDSSLFGGGPPGMNNGPMEYDPTIGGGGFLQVKRLTPTDVEKVRSTPGVSNIQIQYRTNLQYVTSVNAKKYTATAQAYNNNQKPTLSAGKLPSTDLLPSEVIVPEEYVKVLGYGSNDQAIGKQIIISVQNTQSQSLIKTYQISGVSIKPATALNFDGTNLSFSRLDAKELFEYKNLGTPDEDKFLYISAIVPGDQEQIEKVKSNLIQEGFSVQTVKDTQAFLNQLINVLLVVVVSFGTIAVIASFFGVINTQYISVLERTREIGLMKALGMSGRAVSGLFIVESMLIGFIGGVLGVVVAVAIGSALNPVLSKKLNFGQDSLFIFVWWQILILIVILILVALLAGLLPSRKAARLDPIEALRSE